nr:craniofacial development protein 2-like [Tanacetum cinerariifolium]
MNSKAIMLPEVEDLYAKEEEKVLRDLIFLAKHYLYGCRETRRFDRLTGTRRIRMGTWNKGFRAREGNGYNLWYSGFSTARNGVGVILAGRLKDIVVQVIMSSDRIMAITMIIKGETINVISAYAPQVGLSDAEKKSFWDALDKIVREFPIDQRLIIGGDLNSHIGATTEGYAGVHEGFGFRDRNEEGQATSKRTRTAGPSQEWFGCPQAYKIRYVRRDHGPNPFILPEVVASQELWIWHAFFGISRVSNDINVIHQSPLLNDLKQGRIHEIPFVANDVTYRLGYYLCDEIYPKWVPFVMSGLNLAEDDYKRLQHKRKHEVTRKDMELEFGVLKKK